MKRFITFVATAILTLAFVGEASARFRGGGFSRGWSSSRSRSSGWSKSRTRTSTSRNRSRRSAKPKRSKADQKSYEKAKAKGTAFKSKKSAASSFKKKHASKYTSKYDTKPAKRPDHIPSTTTVGGKNYQVSYHPQHGGYGYMGPSGWVMYDAMADAAMLSILMRRNDYYYDRPVVRSSGSHVVLTVGLITLTVIIVGAVSIAITQDMV